MTEITYQQLNDQFDEIISRVEDGETFLIKYENNDFVLLPYKTYKEVVDEYSKLYIEHSNDDQS